MRILKNSFEVTETSIIKQRETSREFMMNCRNVGGNIALDIFGTGLSSLSYLKDFPLDTIKIDGSFIHTILESNLDREIVRCVANIARSIGASTVAECVEDPETIEVLKQLNVDWIQGWATGRPMPLPDALAGASVQGSPARNPSLDPNTIGVGRSFFV